MKTVPLLMGLFATLSYQPPAFGQGTALTYQGRLNDAAGPANGTYDFQFTVRNALTDGKAVGTNPLAVTLAVRNGLFTATLDPGAGVFTGEDRWLEIAVRTNGATIFTTLAPRQIITATPYAVHAGTADRVACPPGMVLISDGGFTMGNSTGDGDIAAATPIDVKVSTFCMDENEVTLSQWQSVYFWATNQGYGFANVGDGKAANHPVQTVNWFDCVKWCNARSQQAGDTPVYYTDVGLTQVYTNGEPATVYPNWAVSGYRLPTEAEWEMAARGGLHGQRFPWGNVINQNLANYRGDTANFSYDLGPNGYHPAFTNAGFPYTSPVGSFVANGYGLNDMVGNVFEWCWDWYGTPYAGGTDPRGPASGSSRVCRGGYWNNMAYLARCARRSLFNPANANNTFGFRCVLPPGP